MTLAHTIYIPFVLAVGFYLGWYFGTRALRAEQERAEKRRRDREAGKIP